MNALAILTQLNKDVEKSLEQSIIERLASAGRILPGEVLLEVITHMDVSGNFRVDCYRDACDYCPVKRPMMRQRFTMPDYSRRQA
jgi:hypothetical protein